LTGVAAAAAAAAVLQLLLLASAVRGPAAVSDLREPAPPPAHGQPDTARRLLPLALKRAGIFLI
jgi:hypothetical protein